MKIPCLREYNIMKQAGDTPEFYATVQKFTDIQDKAELRKFAGWLVSELDNERELSQSLRLPYYPEEEPQEKGFFCNSSYVKIVADYTHMDFLQIFELDIIIYWAWLHDAVVWNCNRSEAGREYLEKCWAGSQKDPDRDALRNLFG